MKISLSIAAEPVELYNNWLATLLLRTYCSVSITFLSKRRGGGPVRLRKSFLFTRYCVYEVEITYWLLPFYIPKLLRCNTGILRFLAKSFTVFKLARSFLRSQ